MAQQIKITQTSNADMNIGIPKKMTAVEWLKEQMHDYDHAPVSNNEEYVIIIPVWIFKDKFNTAKQMEKEQMGYTKEDVLKAGEIGEINHYDYKHIVSLLDEAREINRQNK